MSLGREGWGVSVWLDFSLKLVTHAVHVKLQLGIQRLEDVLFCDCSLVFSLTVSFCSAYNCYSLQGCWNETARLCSYICVHQILNGSLSTFSAWMQLLFEQIGRVRRHKIHCDPEGHFQVQFCWLFSIIWVLNFRNFGLFVFEWNWH